MIETIFLPMNGRTISSFRIAHTVFTQARLSLTHRKPTFPRFARFPPTCAFSFGLSAGKTLMQQDLKGRHRSFTKTDEATFCCYPCW